MNEKELKRLNRITNKLKEIEDFMWYAEKVWTGKFITQKQKYILKSNPYGNLESKSIELDNELKNKMLQVLRDEMKKLKEERGF